MTYFKLFKSKIGRLGLVSVLSVFLIAGTAVGCTPKAAPQPEPGPVVQQPQIDEKAIMDEFKKIIADNAKPVEIFDFMNENANALSKENVSIILGDLEKLQRDSLSKLEEKFYAQELQKEFIEGYIAKKDINDPNSFQSEVIKSLINEAKENGYKVETAEGMFYPIINYSAYKNYVQYMAEDMKAYVEIMATESDAAPAKDAALVIGWDELVERALKQEAFIKKFSESSKLDEVKQLHTNYLSFVFFGLNNTPLFDYQGGVMNADAKAAYEKIDFSTNDSELKQSLKGYMDLLGKSNYKLTKEVEAYRIKIVGR